MTDVSAFAYILLSIRAPCLSSCVTGQLVIIPKAVNTSTVSLDPRQLHPGI